MYNQFTTCKNIRPDILRNYRNLKIKRPKATVLFSRFFSIGKCNLGQKTEDKFIPVAHIQDGYCQTGSFLLFKSLQGTRHEKSLSIFFPCPSPLVSKYLHITLPRQTDDAVLLNINTIRTKYLLGANW